MRILKPLFQYLITRKIIYFLFVHYLIKNEFIKKSYGYINVSNQSIFLKSLIFFGVYERKERIIIEKYLKTGLDIVEFGASLGVITLILSKKGGQKVIAVEANPSLLNNLNLTKSKNQLNNLFIYSRAISYQQGLVKLDIDKNNLGSKISENNGTLVKTIRLEDIIYDNNIKKFVLISDIEGAEIEFILNIQDNNIINNCVQIIIELHESKYNDFYYSKSLIANIIKSKFNMRIIFNSVDVWVFERNASD
jgi:FkbM family methyltransferase